LKGHFLRFFLTSLFLLCLRGEVFSQDRGSLIKQDELRIINTEFKELVAEVKKLVLPLVNDMDSDDPSVVDRAREDLINKIVPYNTAILSLATKIFEVEGVNHVPLNTDFGSRPERQGVVYLYILPYGDHYLNRFSTFLDQMGVMLSYSPQLLLLDKAGASFMPNERMMCISNNVVSSEYRDKSTTIHELLHALFSSMEKLGMESDFISEISFPKATYTGKSYGEPYSAYLSLEEIAAYSENVAYGARAVQREYKKMMGQLTTSFVRIEKIIGDYVYDELIPGTKDIETKKFYILSYQNFLKVINTIFISHKRSEKRHQKIEALLDNVFDENKQDLKTEVLNIVEELYKGEFSLYTNDPSVLKNRDVIFTDLKKELDLQRSRVTLLVQVSKRAVATMQHLLNKIKEPKFYYEAGTDYYDDLVKQGYEDAFDPSRPIKYMGMNSDVRISQRYLEVTLTGRKYTEISIETGSYLDPLKYRTFISGSFSSREELINGLISKLNRQIKMVQQFFVNAGMLDSMMAESPVYQGAESFNMIEQERAIASISDFASTIRQLYIDNIGLNGEKWADVIKEYKKLTEAKEQGKVKLNDQNWAELKNIDPNIRGENVKSGLRSMMAVIVGDAYSKDLTEAELVELFGNTIINEYDKNKGALSFMTMSLLASPDFYTYLDGIEDLDAGVKNVFNSVLKPAYLSYKPNSGGDVKASSVQTDNKPYVPILDSKALNEAYKTTRIKTSRIRSLGR
jgi:hypothetical protein